MALEFKSDEEYIPDGFHYGHYISLLGNVEGFFDKRDVWLNVPAHSLEAGCHDITHPEVGMPMEALIWKHSQFTVGYIYFVSDAKARQEAKAKMRESLT